MRSRLLSMRVFEGFFTSLARLSIGYLSHWRTLGRIMDHRKEAQIAWEISTCGSKDGKRPISLEFSEIDQLRSCS